MKVKISVLRIRISRSCG